jgi:hypothetical protein
LRFLAGDTGKQKSRLWEPAFCGCRLGQQPELIAKS